MKMAGYKIKDAEQKSKLSTEEPGKEASSEYKINVILLLLLEIWC